jgi:hypothetical protein
VWCRAALAARIALTLGRHTPAAGVAVVMPPGMSCMAPQEAASDMPNRLAEKSTTYAVT